MLKEDKLWKNIIEDLTADFILLAFPDAHTIVDFGKRPEFLDKELRQKSLTAGKRPSTKIVDKLIKVFTLNGDYMLLHVEVQNKYSPQVGSRMMTYYFRIRDTHQKPVTALILLTEHIKKERPKFYKEEHMGTSLHYCFNTYEVINQSDEKLLENTNPFALVIIAAKLKGDVKLIKDPIDRDNRLMNQKLNLVRKLKERHLEPEKEIKLFAFINNYISLDINDNRVKFDNEVDKLRETREVMGMVELIISDAKKKGKREGKLEGRLEGKLEGIRDGKIAVAIELNKVGVSFDVIAQATQLTLKEIQELAITGSSPTQNKPT